MRATIVLRAIDIQFKLLFIASDERNVSIHFLISLYTRIEIGLTRARLNFMQMHIQHILLRKFILIPVISVVSADY